MERFKMHKPYEFSAVLKPGDSLLSMMKAVEVHFITEALIDANHNRVKAAQILGINRTTLVMKMKARGFKLNLPSRK